MLTKYDIGKLSQGVRVSVDGRLGTVSREHEPQWRDHKTRRWMHELQGADITFDDEKGCSRYIHCDKITIIDNTPCPVTEQGEVGSVNC